MEIRFENETGFEIDCGCGARFATPGKAPAQCPRCGSQRELSALFEDWWRSEPTIGRFGYREA